MLEEIFGQDAEYFEIKRTIRKMRNRISPTSFQILQPWNDEPESTPSRT